MAPARVISQRSVSTLIQIKLSGHAHDKHDTTHAPGINNSGPLACGTGTALL